MPTMPPSGPSGPRKPPSAGRRVSASGTRPPKGSTPAGWSPVPAGGTGGKPGAGPKVGAGATPNSAGRGSKNNQKPDSAKKVAANEAARQSANAAITAATGGTAAPVVKAFTNLIGNDQKAKRNRRRLYIAIGALMMLHVLVLGTLLSVVLITVMGGGTGASGTARRDQGQCLDITAPRITQPGAAAPGSGGASAGTLGAPLDPQYMQVTSGFGNRDAPTAGATSFHDGVDFSAPGIYGKPIYAPADGVVSQAGPASGYGNWVIIDHTINGQKVSTLYGHIEDGHVLVHAGQHVTAGQHIADVGNAGASTGAHLHFGVYPGGWRSQGGVDPMPWLSRFRAQANTNSATAPAAAPTTAAPVAAAAPAAAQPAGTVTAADWESLAKLESGNNWAINTSNGYSGGVQFTASTWTANGGGKFAPQAWQATKQQQMEVANNVLKTQGWGAWPPSARVPGLRDKRPAPEGTFVGGAQPAAAAPQQQTAAASLPSSPRGNERNLQAAAQRGMRLAEQQFPQVQTIGGYRPGSGDHGDGSAIDVMVPNYASPDGIALGDRIAKFYIDNAGELKVKYVIWRNRIWQNGTWTDYGHTGDDNDRHNNHVHVSFLQSGPPTATVLGLPGTVTSAASTAGGGQAAPDGVQPYQPTGTQKSQSLTPEQQANIKALIAAARRSGITPTGRAAVLAVAYAGAQTNFISKMPTNNDPRIGIFGEVPLEGTADTSNLINVPYAANAFFDRLKQVAATDQQWATEPLSDVLVKMFPDQATNGPGFGTWEQLSIGAVTQLWADPYSQPNASTQTLSNTQQSCAQGSVLGRILRPGSVPERFVKWITLAGQLCDGITAPLIAAQIRAESGFNENATSSTGAEGSSQFQPTTWPTWGSRVDDNGRPISPPGTGNPRNAADATMAQGRMMCADLANMKKLIASGRVHGDPVALTIAAYNAGIGAVINAGGMPSGGDYTTQTQPYVARILEWAREYDGGAGQLAPTAPAGSSSGGRQQVVQVALAQRGKPYVWGATGPDSFDCSGLVMFAYAKAGIKLPRTSENQWTVGTEVSAAQAQPGDLVFSEFGADGPGHVQMYIGNNQVVEAQQSGVPVKISPLSPSGKIKHISDSDAAAAAAQ